MTDPHPQRSVEKTLHRLLLNSRFLVLIAVSVSLLVGLGMFIVATVDAAMLVVPVVTYPFAQNEADHATLRNNVVTHIVEVVDGYLLASVMLIFAVGLYVLFIAPLSDGDHAVLPPGMLMVRSFDDLKDRLAKVVLLILIVKFFEHALELPVHTPVDLLSMAVAIALIAAAIAITHPREKAAKGAADPDPPVGPPH